MRTHDRKSTRKLDIVRLEKIFPDIISRFRKLDNTKRTKSTKDTNILRLNLNKSESAWNYKDYIKWRNLPEYGVLRAERVRL